MVWEWRCSEDLEEKDDWFSYWINDKGVFRTAAATPGLLKIMTIFLQFVTKQKKLGVIFFVVFLSFVGKLSIFLAIDLPLYAFFR